MMRVSLCLLAIPFVLGRNIRRQVKCRDGSSAAGNANAGAAGLSSGGAPVSPLPAAAGSPGGAPVSPPPAAASSLGAAVPSTPNGSNSSSENAGPSTGSNGAERRGGEVLEATGSNMCDGPYGVNPKGDIPMSRGTRGNLILYPKGEGNHPDYATDKWPDQGGTDSPLQSACGIPHNAYSISHVAIHPYWLNYAPLERYCMPDVCISFWNPSWTTDMMLKVTDICSTDPSSPTSCKKPGDIKVDRTKVKIWSGKGGDKRDAIDIPGLEGNVFADETVWYFRKCWDDGMLQPPYDHDGNSYATPKWYNNLEQSAEYNTDQYFVNQAVFPVNRKYENCQTNPKCQGTPIQDWAHGQADPDWEPICGGQGFSGKKASPNSRCPKTQGVGGTPDLGTNQTEFDKCRAIGDQARNGGKAALGQPG